MLFKLKLTDHTATQNFSGFSFEALTMEDKPMNAFVSVSISHGKNQDPDLHRQNDWVSYMPCDVRTALGLTCEQGHQQHFESDNTLKLTTSNLFFDVSWNARKQKINAIQYAHKLLAASMQEQRTLS